MLVGAAFGVQRDDLDYNGTLNGSSAELQNNRATLYGELALSGNAFLDAMLTMGSTEQETVRNAGISGTAMSEADHEMWGARVAVGTSMALGSSMTLTPQARFDWAYLDMESYRETGAGPMSLLVDDNDEERERGSLAAQIDWNLNTTTIPYVRASWGHEFGDDDVDTVASFNGASAQFMTAEEVMDTDGFTAGFGLNIVNAGSLEGSFGYDYNENGDYDSDLLHARLLMRF